MTRHKDGSGINGPRPERLCRFAGYCQSAARDNRVPLTTHFRPPSGGRPPVRGFRLMTFPPSSLQSRRRRVPVPIYPVPPTDRV
ncbi:hypothetical protein DM2_410 [Halorubrum sp. DM2]|nr:hypothetical protein DM2_410 [Halorubrum sp. DM2]